jgi:hypothetical protein
MPAVRWAHVIRVERTERHLSCADIDIEARWVMTT